MSNFENLNLIDGVFSNEEAKEILMNVFSTKILFHELKNFSSEERFGKPDKTASKRIPELKKEVEKVLQILSEAKINNKTLRISSEINIKLLDDSNVHKEVVVSSY
jgi:hypothetical protein